MPSTLNPTSPTQPTAPAGISGGNWNCEVHDLGTGGYEGTVYVRTLGGRFLYSTTLQGNSVSQLLLDLAAIGQGSGQFQ